MSQLLLHLEIHRDLVRNGDTAQAGRIESLIDQDLAALITVDRELNRELETTGAALNARRRGQAAPTRLQSEWEAVKLAADPAASERLHLALIENVRTLITHVGDSSELTLDPDLDTYYVMDALLLKEPEIIDELGNLSALVDTQTAAAAALVASSARCDCRSRG